LPWITLPCRLPPSLAPTAFLSANAPGIDYDPINSQLVAWIGGTDYYTCTIPATLTGTWTWTPHTPSGTGPAAVSTGTYGRFRYASEINCFVAYTAYNVNAYVLNPNSSIAMSTRTWFQVTLPVSTDNRPMDVNGTTKHMRICHNPVDSKLYFMSGDHSAGTPVGQLNPGGNQRMFTYDVANDIWVKNQEYCRVGGQVQMALPDQVTWTWDSVGGHFIACPGYQGVVPVPRTWCLDSVEVEDELMWYTPDYGSPTLGYWSQVTQPTGTFYKTSVAFGVYDPWTNKLYRFHYAGRPYPSVSILDLNVSPPVATNTTFSAYSENEAWNQSMCSLDNVRHKIYIYLRPTRRIYSYDIATNTMSILTTLTAIPVFTIGQVTMETMSLYDPQTTASTYSSS